MTYDKSTAPGPEFVYRPTSEWLNCLWKMNPQILYLFLDQAYDAVTPGSYAVVETLDPKDYPSRAGKR